MTQLYVSVDASTKESLKKVDRPLFTDFWERFLACLDALGTKGQRTGIVVGFVHIHVFTLSVYFYPSLISSPSSDSIPLAKCTGSHWSRTIIRSNLQTTRN